MTKYRIEIEFETDNSLDTVAQLANDAEVQVLEPRSDLLAQPIWNVYTRVLKEIV